LLAWTQKSTQILIFDSLAASGRVRIFIPSRHKNFFVEVGKWKVKEKTPTSQVLKKKMQEIRQLIFNLFGLERYKQKLKFRNN
jgi:hypothetical protein